MHKIIFHVLIFKVKRSKWLEGTKGIQEVNVTASFDPKLGGRSLGLDHVRFFHAGPEKHSLNKICARNNFIILMGRRGCQHN